MNAEPTARQRECEEACGHCFHEFDGDAASFDECCACGYRKNEVIRAEQGGLPL